MAARAPLPRPAPDARLDEPVEAVRPAHTLTYEEQLAEFARLVDEARMRT